MRIGLDQTVAWITSVLFTALIFGVAAVGINYSAKNPFFGEAEKAVKDDNAIAKGEKTSPEAKVEGNKYDELKIKSDDRASETVGAKTDERPPEDGSHSSNNIAWHYRGTEGPEHWGELSEEFGVCSSGESQSPVNIIGANRSKDLMAIKFFYNPSKGKYFNDGHTVQVNVEPGNYFIADGRRYDLVQFHFHVPSEHKIDGMPYDAEIHLVHKNNAGEYAVVALLVEEGTKNGAIAGLWNKLPTKNDAPMDTPVLKIKDLLPKKPTYFHYTGSLTTPPCSENVNWFVMEEPVKFSSTQIDEFIKLVQFNSRPVQPLNGRKVVKSWK